MPSDSIVRKIIDTRIRDNWIKTPVAKDNSKFKPVRGTTFIKPTFSGVGTDVIGLNCRKKRYLLIIQVNIERGVGVKTAVEYAEELVDLFEGYVEGNFHCNKGHVERIATDKAWHQRSAVLECSFKEYKT